MTEKLLCIFQIVNDWLKFAEAKNAVLLAFCSAAITAIITYLSTASTIPIFFQYGLLISILLLCISSLICSLSFLPKTDIEHFVWSRTKSVRNSKSSLKDSDNFYFFNNLNKYDSNDLLEAMNRLYFEGTVQKPYRKEDLDIASQITINSEIASTKFRFFRIALWLLIFSIFIVLISLVIAILIYRKV
ncbi:Pycsar system effector family protein [Microcoleus sp. AT3-D2]|uniref:Pycsar system effector family protein n=1 Tax=Microcoleus sp. AT3-D2 TaxID=2818612 RepID=UPI002FD45953